MFHKFELHKSMYPALAGQLTIVTSTSTNASGFTS